MNSEQLFYQKKYLKYKQKYLKLSKLAKKKDLVMFNSHNSNQTGGTLRIPNLGIIDGIPNFGIIDEIKKLSGASSQPKPSAAIEEDLFKLYDTNELLLLILVILFIYKKPLTNDQPDTLNIEPFLNKPSSNTEEFIVNNDNLAKVLNPASIPEDFIEIKTQFLKKKNTPLPNKQDLKFDKINNILTSNISISKSKRNTPYEFANYLLYDFAPRIGIMVGSTDKNYTDTNTDIGNVTYDRKYANMEMTKVNNTIVSLGLNISAIFASIKIFLVGLLIPPLVSTGIGFVAVATVSIAIGLMFRFQSTKWSEYKDTAQIILGQLLSIQEHVIKMKLFYTYLISSDNSKVKNMLGKYDNIENYNNPLVKLEVCIYKLMYNILTHIDWTTSIMIGKSKNKRRVDLYNNIKKHIIEPYFEFREPSFLYGQFGGTQPRQEEQQPLIQQPQEEQPQEEQEQQEQLPQQQPPTEKLRYSTKTCQHIKGINNDKYLNAKLKAQCNNINDKILRLIEYKFLFLKIHTKVENDAKKDENDAKNEDKERLEILKSNIPEHLHESNINVSNKFNEWRTANSNYTVLVREHVIITSLLAEATFIYNDHIAVLTNNSDTKDFITTFFSKYRRTQIDLNKTLNSTQELLSDIPSDVGADVEAGDVGNVGNDGNVGNVGNDGNVGNVGNVGNNGVSKLTNENPK